jgi:hypothetical protein
MAKVNQNIVVQGLIGSLGRQLVCKRDKAGRTLVTRRPTFAEDRTSPPPQRTQQAAFRRATPYALSAKDDPIYARLAEGTPRNPYNVAIADWFHPPQILEVDLGCWRGQPGQLIRVQASDDVLVKQVTVAIADASGTLLEHGPATQVDDLSWHYTTTSTATGSLNLIVAAQDLPGHITQMIKAIP